jgi:peptidoglycan/xylan/chitin deacetylase (PgdA/CDA1 family)
MNHDSRKTALLVIVLAVAVVIGLTGNSLSPMSIIGAQLDVAQTTQTPTVTPEIDDTPPTVVTVDPTRSQGELPAPTPTDQPQVPPTPQPTPTEEAQPGETPRPSVPENTTGASILVARGTSGAKEIALTFDAGEGTGYTTEILDFLAQHDIHASFGITGTWARAYPELVQRMVDEGHMVINHSESHQSWTGVSTTGIPLTEDQRIDELLNAATAIEDAVEDYETAPFWRPPYGDYDQAGQELLVEYGYDYTLMWTCDTLAWSGTTPEEIVAKCAPDAEGGGPGAIVLMHVTQEADYLSLEGLVAAYQAEGYEFVTMEEMIAG